MIDKTLENGVFPRSFSNMDFLEKYRNLSRSGVVFGKSGVKNGVQELNGTGHLE